ncbi:unnamed protein product [Hymenolepis diminuta]|uniref:Uncharacterized protein n=1 Tax=Hymenolepis diminuta TaxID=6216 RepID=A0A0R3SXM2_HYMDI|nr:unnamed protein product [Hymenolepis diminuta]
MKEDDTVYEGNFRNLTKPKILNWHIHDDRWPEQRIDPDIRRGNSFSNRYDAIITERLAKHPQSRYKGAHTVSLASYLNHHHNQGVNNFSPLYQRDALEERWLHNGSTLSVPHDTSEAEYEFTFPKQLLLICPQSVPLQRKSVGPRVGSHSNLQPKNISDNTESNFSIDNLSRLSTSGLTSRCESEPHVIIPTPTYSMAKLRQRTTNQDVTDQSSNAPILAPSNLLFPSGHNNLGDTMKNDSIDLGETGRINYRTGSFLGRFTNHSGESKVNKKGENATNSQQTRGGQTLNDYMVSGQLNKSVTSAPENSYNHTSLNRSTLLKRLVPKVPIELSKTAELDPVLALLLSDVSQLDEFRNNFRDKTTE